MRPLTECVWEFRNNALWDTVNMHYLAWDTTDTLVNERRACQAPFFSQVYSFMFI